MKLLLTNNCKKIPAVSLAPQGVLTGAKSIYKSIVHTHMLHMQYISKSAYNYDFY